MSREPLRFEIHQGTAEDLAAIMRKPAVPRVYQYTAIRAGRRVKYATLEEAKAVQRLQCRAWVARNPEKRAENSRRKERRRTETRRRLAAARPINPDRVLVDRKKKRAMKAHLKLGLLFKQGYRCAQCAAFFRDRLDCHGDHILPRSLNGPDDIENRQLLCSWCNAHKLDQHPVDYARRLGLL